MGIYLDSAATTKMYKAVKFAMEPFYDYYYANPSSKYNAGREARHAVDDAREVIATMIGAKPQEIYFTSGGSESNSWAIKGIKNKFKRMPMHIISSTQEHHSLLRALDTRWELANDIEYTLVAADNEGFVDTDEIKDSFQLNTRLCSIMTVNNETGIIQPIQKIAYMCKDRGIIFHTDAVQAFGFLNINVEDLGIDMLSASAHKIHGPKGVGFLYMTDEIRNQFLPLINGGQQERGLRGSTENVASIVGFAKAAEIAKECMTENNRYIKELCEKFVTMLSEIPGVHTNVNLRYTDYRHISLRLDGIRAEEMLSLLDSVGIYVSSGSACNSDSHKPSHVLKAIGLSNDAANSTIRVSLSTENTLEELQAFVEYLKQFLEILRGRTS